MEEMQGSGVSISCAPLAALCPQISQYADNEPLEKKSRTDSVRMSYRNTIRVVCCKAIYMHAFSSPFKEMPVSMSVNATSQ